MEEERFMKFGNASWGFREMQLEDQLRNTRDMNFEFLELGIANAAKDLPVTAKDGEIRKVKELFEKYGIKLRYAATGNDFTNKERGDVEKLCRVIDISAKLGVRYLRIFAGFSPVEEVIGPRWNNMISCIREVDFYARRKGVILVIETHGGVKKFEDGVMHYMSTSTHPQALERMLAELPDTVKVNFDPANLWAAGISKPELIYEICRERVAMVHLKDFARMPSGHLKPAACGEGDVDLKPVLKKLEDYGGVILFEYENPEDVTEGTIRCYEYVQALRRRGAYE